MKSRITSVFGFLVTASSLVFGQATGSSLAGTSAGARSGGMRGSASFGAPPPFARQIVKGAPYSGEEVFERVQTVADGTRFTQSNLQRKVFRDSEGRMRTERPVFMGNAMGNAPSDSPMVIEITDPVAGFHFVLDVQRKAAHRQVLPEAPQLPNVQGMLAPQMAVRGGSGMAASGDGRLGAMTSGVMGGIIGSVPSIAPGAPVPASVVFEPAPATIRADGWNGATAAPNGSQPKMPKNSSESLGTQTINGVLIEGTRHTTTYPVGMMGNDREFSTTSETWMSPELHLMVISKNNDARTGENTFRIANLSRTPPDPSLFMVPSDYTVVDENGSFNIAFGQ